MASRCLFRRIFRFLLYTFLLTLPFTFQAHLAGLLFAKYHSDQISRGVSLYLHELDRFTWGEQWSVPGALSFSEFQTRPAAPFWVPQLRSNSWTEALGLTQPGAWREDFFDETPINQLVSLEGVVRDLGCGAHGAKPTEWWVFVSRMAMPMVFEWDQAFVELMEWHEMHPPVSSTGGEVAFAYVDCGFSSFLCHVWQVHHPALVHFRVDMDGEVTADDVGEDDFASPLEQLRPVEVRIFDLGLQQEVSPLAPAVFPSELEQMKALTMNLGAYTVEDDFSQLAREFHEFYERYYFPACNKQGSFLDYTSEFDNFMVKKIASPIGLETAADILAGVAFTISMALGSSYYLVANPVGDFFTHFLGKRTEVDELVEQMREREQVVERGGIFGSMHLDFLEQMEDYVQDQIDHEALDVKVTTKKEEVRSLFAGMRENMSSIWAGT